MMQIRYAKSWRRGREWSFVRMEQLVQLETVQGELLRKPVTLPRVREKVPHSYTIWHIPAEIPNTPGNE